MPINFDPESMHTLEFPDDRRPFIVAGILLVLAMMSLPLDATLSQVLRDDAIPGEIGVALNRAEPFGHGYGVLFILITLRILTQCNYRVLGTLALCSLGAGLAADIVKLFIWRVRPYAMTEEHAASIFSGFVPWSQSGSYLEAFGHSVQSFPSAHSATAFGFAVGLSALFPKGRKWFLALAVLVAVQRVVNSYHYVSDVLVGAAIGIAFAHQMVRVYVRRQSTIEAGTSAEKDPIPVNPTVAAAGENYRAA